MKSKTTVLFSLFVIIPLMAIALETKVSLKTAAVRDVTSTGAVGGYTLTVTGGTVTKHGICINKKAGPTVANTKFGADKGPGPSFNVQITGLAPGIKYYIRSFATSAEGVTTYGNEISFTTPVPKK